MLIGLGFPPFEASALSLIANTAPVAFGALGTPIIALQGVTGLDLGSLSAMVGRQLPFFSLIVPFWLIAAYAGFSGMLEVWPALLVAGVAFAVPQFLVSNFHGPWLVDIVAVGVLDARAGGVSPFLARRTFERPDHAAPVVDAERERTAPSLGVALLPWIVLVVVVFAWGTPQVKSFSQSHFVAEHSDRAASTRWSLRVPPVVPKPTPKPAVFSFNWLSATGTAILIAAIVAGIALRYSATDLVRALCDDASRGVAVAAHDHGDAGPRLHDAVFRTRRDSRTRVRAHRRGVSVLRGDARVARRRAHGERHVVERVVRQPTEDHGDATVGLSPVLMAAANSSGGVMGKMIDAQSIVVASTATGWTGHEWRILRFVFFHSLALASLVGLLVVLQQYVFTGMLVR